MSSIETEYSGIHVAKSREILSFSDVRELAEERAAILAADAGLTESDANDLAIKWARTEHGVSLTVRDRSLWPDIIASASAFFFVCRYASRFDSCGLDSRLAHREAIRVLGGQHAV